MKDALDTTREITKLIKLSPKREAKLNAITAAIKIDQGAENHSVGIRMLCPTRWTVKAQAMDSIILNYTELDDLWKWSLEDCKDTEMKARIRGVQAHMSKFDFFFGLVLRQCLLKHSDNLSATLQSQRMSAAEAHSHSQNDHKNTGKS